MYSILWVNLIYIFSKRCNFTEVCGKIEFSGSCTCFQYLESFFFNVNNHRRRPEFAATYFSHRFWVIFRWYFEVMHAVIKALESKKAVIFGSNLEMRTSKIMTCENVIFTQIQHGGQRVQKVLMEAYQTVRVCQGFTALPSDTVSSIWPSNHRDIFLKSFLSQGEILFFFTSTDHTHLCLAILSVTPKTILTEGLQYFLYIRHWRCFHVGKPGRDMMEDGTYCFEYQDKTPSWRTTQ